MLKTGKNHKKVLDEFAVKFCIYSLNYREISVFHRELRKDCEIALFIFLKLYVIFIKLTFFFQFEPRLPCLLRETPKEKM